MALISELISRLSRNVRIYEDHLQTHDLPLPSHEVQTSLTDAPAPVPDNVRLAQNAAIEDCYELRNLLMGPAASMLDVSSELKALSLHFVIRFKIYLLFGLNERMSFEEIARTCKLDVLDARRLLRMAMAERIFFEPEEGIVAHTAASQALAQDSLLAAWLDLVTRELLPSTLKLVDAMIKFPGSQEPNQTAYGLAHDTNLTPFQIWEQDPDRAARMADGMSYWKNSPGFEANILALHYDFSTAKTFVDVGGSSGFISNAVARGHPHLQIIVQDLPATVRTAESQGNPPEDVRDRVSFMAHDFWSTQPVQGADIYFFRLVFHDWSDEYCYRILRQLAPALKSGSKVLINDACIPPWGSATPYQARRLHAVDLTVKSFSNARERSEEDWRDLFAKADSRFTFLGVTLPPGAALSFIEAEWNP